MWPQNQGRPSGAAGDTEFELEESIRGLLTHLEYEELVFRI